MGKNKFLDFGYKRQIVLKKISHLLSILVVFFSVSCSLPRIIILDDPLSPEEHLNLGVTYEHNSEFDNALKEYEIASRNIPMAYVYMGNVYFQMKAYESAEANYKEAIKNDPKNADAYNNLAWLFYIRKENIDEAEALVLKAIDLNPSKRYIYQDTLEKIRGLTRTE
jgi:tetratricopeptide (TPR) repeat protein